MMDAVSATIFYGVLAIRQKTSSSSNSLQAIDAHERQLINKLLCSLVTSTIFVRC